MTYFERRPIGWRSDDRIYKVLQTQGVKEQPWKIFQTLQPIYHPVEPLKDGQISVSNLKSSFMFSKMLGATGGDKLDL